MIESNQAAGEARPPEAVPGRKPIRWWPARVILALTVAAVIAIRLWSISSHQQKNIYTAEAIILAVVLWLLWVLFFSRLRWFVRLAVFGGVAGLIALTACLFRIHGVTGDLLPILEWRWKRPAAAGVAGGEKRAAPPRVGTFF